MNILLDSCVWGGALRELAESGHDTVWSGNWERDPGDEEILATAVREQRILVTLDKDFGELVFLHGLPHCGIVRLVNISATKQAAVLLDVMARHQDDLNRGAVITAEADRLRIRLPGA